MYAFDYIRPTTLEQAAALVRQGAQCIAGGQSLLPALKLRLAQPSSLVDLGSLTELQGVREEGQSLVIGAMTRHQDVANSPVVRSKLAALAQLASGIGDRQVRARGTLGGSVANNDPAACYPSAVLALDATVITNRREISAGDFFQGMYSTALEPGELIVAIRFPIPEKAAYAKFRQPASRFALVGVFVAKTTHGVRVAITGAGYGVFRHSGLEDALSANFTPEAVADVEIGTDNLGEDIHASAAYRAHLIKVQTQRAVSMALGKEV